MKKYQGKLIFEGKDDFGVVEVVDRPHIRTLHFGTPTEQSSMYLDKPYGLEMEYIRNMTVALLFRPDARHILSLGLGGGAIPKFAWKYYPNSHVTSVELSPLVIDVATRFFYLPQDKRMEIRCQDALAYLEQEAIQQDLIFVDLYVDKGIAPIMGDTDFFPSCYDRLAPGGILAWNLWRSSAKELIEASLGSLATIFGRNLLILPNKESSNCVVIAFKEPIEAYSKTQILAEAKRLQHLTGIDFPKMLEDLHYFKSYGYLFQDWA